MPDPRLELDPAADDQKLLAQVVGFYHETLKKTQTALDYLTGRGLTSPALIDRFRLGFSDRSLGTKLPSKAVKSGEAIRTRLLRLGLFKESGHERFRGSITVPVTAADGSGRIVDIYGMKIGHGLRATAEVHTHLTADRPGVFNVEAFGAVEEIVLCPSVWDALTFWNSGFRNVTAMFGTDALTDDLLGAFEEFGIRRVLTTSEKIVEKLLAVGLEAFVVRLPPGLDVNAFASTTTDPADALGALLRGAEWAGKGQPPTAPLVATPTIGSDVALAGLLDADDEDEDEPDDLDDEADQGVEDEPGFTSARAPAAPEPPVRTASPVPPVPTPDGAAVTETEVILTFGTRRYRVRGLNKNASPDVLKVNVLASNGVGMHVDTLDLYSAKHRSSFVEQAAAELNIEAATVKHDLGRVLLKLEEVQDARLREAEQVKPVHPEMTAADRDEALALLRDPKLLDRIVDDFAVVGERTNKLVGYLAAVSRKLDQPLAVLIQSTSAAGKTTLMESVLSMVPPEDVVKFSAMTGQSLYYMPEGGLKHRILAIVEEEGAAKASYALKLLQSEGELRIASTGKETASGRLTAQEYRVEGPTMLFLTTTSISVDEELLNRCLVLTVQEDREQTRAIHALQRHRQTLGGMLAAQTHNATLARHRNAQRLLRPLLVVNPHAEKLTFLDAKTRTRRDHAKYLTLIRTITLLHQHQRPVRTVEHLGRAVEFIEATVEDIAAANALAADVLGRCLDDLPPQTRALLVLLDNMVKARCGTEDIDRSEFRFSRREVREHTGWGDTQLKLHLKRLVDLEYLLVHRDREAKRHRYELLYTTGDGDRALPGLIDVAELRREAGDDRPGFEARRSGSEGDRSGSGRPAAGPESGHGRPAEIDENTVFASVPPSLDGTASESTNGA